MTLHCSRLLALLALITLVCPMTAGSEPGAARRPNVLLICVDDLKPVLGCYGDQVALTPHIDQLAARGVSMTSAYCNQAVCSPSRNALLTSLRPQTLGIYDLPTNFRHSRPDAVTLGQFFQQSGYTTAALGKIFHVGHGNQEDAASWSVPHWRPKAPGYALPESTANSRSSAQGPRGNATEAADVPDNTYADGQIAEEAIRRLEAARQHPDQPFLLAVGFLKPHLPFVAPQRYWDLYQREQMPMPIIAVPPDGAPEYAPTNSGELRQYADIPAKGSIDIPLARRLVHGYYAAASYTDAQIGRVLQRLRELQLEQNTIVVLWGDHGWHLGDHGMWCKHTNYEQAARIPLIVAGPGLPAGARSAALVESVDVYPTLAELAGLPQPAGVDGRSFAAALRQEPSPGRDHVIHVYPRGARIGRAIRTPRYRLVEWKVPGADPATAELELYDYIDDPHEDENLASERPAVVAELRSLLATHPEAVPQIKVAQPAASGNKSGRQPQDRQAMFQRRDTDGNGELSKAEFLKNQPDPQEAPQRFERFDVDDSGTLSRDEFITGGKPATKP